MNLIDEMVKRYLDLQKAKAISIDKFNTYIKLKEKACMKGNTEWEVNYTELAIKEKHNIDLIDDAIIILIKPILLNDLQL